MDCQPVKSHSPYHGPILDEVEEHFQRSLRGLQTPKPRTLTPSPLPPPPPLTTQPSHGDQKVSRRPLKMEMHSSGVVESGHAMSTTKPARPQAQLASVVVQPASPSPMTPLTPGGGHALFMNMSHGPQLVPSPTIMSEISQGVTVIELARRSHDRPAPQQTSVINMVSGGMTSPQPMSLSPTSNRMAFNVQNKGSIQAIATSSMMPSPQSSSTPTYSQTQFVHMVDSSQPMGTPSPIMLFQMPMQTQPNFLLVNSADLGFQAGLMSAGLAGLSALPTTSGLIFFHSGGGAMQQAIPISLGTVTSNSDQPQHIGGMRNTVLMATPNKTTPTSFTPSVGPTPTITAAAKVVVPLSPIKPKELSAEHVSSIMGVPESVDDHFAKALGEEWTRVKGMQHHHGITAQSL